MWVCPDCAAQHHVSCAEELSHCGACPGGDQSGALIPPPEPPVIEPAPLRGKEAGRRESASEVSAGIHESGDPLQAEEDALRELEALGFAWEPKSRRAFHPAWSHGSLLGPQELVVAVSRREGELTWAEIQADAQRLTDGGQRLVLGFYLVDQLDGRARYALAQGSAPWPYFPVVRVRALRETFYPRQLATLRPGRILLQPGLRYLARRLLTPSIERERTRERLSGAELTRLLAPPAGVLVMGLAAAIGLAGLSQSAAPYLAFGLLGLGSCLRWAYFARQAFSR